MGRWKRRYAWTCAILSDSMNRLLFVKIPISYANETHTFAIRIWFEIKVREKRIELDLSWRKKKKARNRYNVDRFPWWERGWLLIWIYVVIAKCYWTGLQYSILISVRKKLDVSITFLILLEANNEKIKSNLSKQWIWINVLHVMSLTASLIEFETFKGETPPKCGHNQFLFCLKYFVYGFTTQQLLCSFEFMNKTEHCRAFSRYHLH